MTTGNGQRPKVNTDRAMALYGLMMWGFGVVIGWCVGHG